MNFPEKIFYTIQHYPIHQKKKTKHILIYSHSKQEQDSIIPEARTIPSQVEGDPAPKTQNLLARINSSLFLIKVSILNMCSAPKGYCEILCIIVL